MKGFVPSGYVSGYFPASDLSTEASSIVSFRVPDHVLAAALENYSCTFFFKILPESFVLSTLIRCLMLEFLENPYFYYNRMNLDYSRNHDPIMDSYNVRVTKPFRQAFLSVCSGMPISLTPSVTIRALLDLFANDPTIFYNTSFGGYGDHIEWLSGGEGCYSADN